ncbi:hypothetical protein ACTPOK_36405 [Streptomyces inhibens]|uniref:hypothetical protein n=1 Tax=Streptomyces inhibens TaxID=2293571 RepID=UPI00402A807E
MSPAKRELPGRHGSGEGRTGVAVELLVNDRAATVLTRAGVHSYTLLPLTARGQILGFLGLSRAHCCGIAAASPRPISGCPRHVARIGRYGRPRSWLPAVLSVRAVK